MPSPIRVRTAETVESAIVRQNAISAPVIRNLRSAAIASTSSSGVRCAIDFGAEERSCKPGSHSARYHLTHFEQPRSLTPAASAASASDHSCSTTRPTIVALPFGPSGALA